MISPEGKAGAGLLAGLAGKKLSPVKASPAAKKDDLMNEMKLALSRRQKKEQKPPTQVEETTVREDEITEPVVTPLRIVEVLQRPRHEPERQPDFRSLLKRRHHHHHHSHHEAHPVVDQQIRLVEERPPMRKMSHRERIPEQIHFVQDQPRHRKLSHKELIPEPQHVDFRSQPHVHRHHHHRHHHHKHDAGPTDAQMVQVVEVQPRPTIIRVQEPPAQMAFQSRLRQTERAPRQSVPTIRPVEIIQAAVRPSEADQTDRRPQPFQVKRKRVLSNKPGQPARPSMEETDSESDSDSDVVEVIEPKPARRWGGKPPPKPKERKESENELMKIFAARRKKNSRS